MSTDTSMIWLIGATWGWGEGKLRVGRWISPRQTAEAHRPGQAFFPHWEWWVSCFSYRSGRGEDALLAVEEHNRWIWIFFHVCCVSPHLWQDSVRNLLHPFGFFRPLVIWSYAMNGNQRQQEKLFLVFLTLLAPSITWVLVGSAESQTLPRTNESNKFLLTRNQAVPRPWMSPLKDPLAASVTLRSRCSCHPPEWSPEWSLRNLPDGARTLGGEKWVRKGEI